MTGKVHEFDGRVGLHRTFEMMPTILPGIAIMLLILTFCTREARAQEPLVQHPQWFTIAFGGSGPERAAGALISYNTQPRTRVFHLSFQYSTDLSFSGYALTGATGLRRAAKYGMFAALVGSSLAHYDFGSSKSGRPTLSPGVAGMIQGYMKPWADVVPEIGVGIEVSANADLTRQYYSIKLGILLSNGL